MRFFYLFQLFLAFYPNYLSAQSAFEQTIGKSCACFEKQNFDNLEKAAIEAIADSCVQDALIYNLSALQKELNLDINNRRQGAEFGENLGKSMYERCPAYRRYWESIAEAELEEQQEEKNSVKGLLESVKPSLNGQKMQICIRLRNDSLQCFGWQQPFINDGLFLGATDSLLGREIRVFYDNSQLINPQSRRYEPSAVLWKVDLLAPNASQANFIHPDERKKRQKAAKAEQKERVRLAKEQLERVKKGLY